ncbi:MAG: FHA domain-containing protein [Planctomycetota bacterium]
MTRDSLSSGDEPGGQASNAVSAEDALSGEAGSPETGSPETGGEPAQPLPEEARRARDLAREAEALLVEVGDVAGRWEKAKGEVEARERAVSEARAVLDGAVTDALEALEEVLPRAGGPLREARRLLERLQVGASGLERRARETRALLDKHRKERDRWVLELEPLETRAGALRTELEAGAKELEELSARIAELEERERARVEALGEAREALQAKRKEAEALAHESQRAKAAGSERGEEIAASQRALEEQEAALAPLREALEVAQRKRGEANAALEARRAAQAAAEAEVEAAEEAYKDARSAAADASQALSRAGTEEEETAAEEAEAEALERRTEAKGRVKATREARDAAWAECEAAERELAAADQVVAEAQAELSAGEAALNEARAAHAQLSRRSDTKRLAEQKGAAAQAAAEMRDLAEVAAAGLESELISTRSELEALRVRLATQAGGRTRRSSQLTSAEEALGQARGSLEGAAERYAEAERRLREHEATLTGEQGAQQRVLLEVQRIEALEQERSAQLAELRGDAATTPKAGAPSEELDAEAWDALAWCEEGQEEVAEEEEAAEEPTPTPSAPTKKTGRPPVAAHERRQDVEDGTPSFRLAVSLPNTHVGDFEFAQDEVVIGRESTCDVPLDSPVISRRHAIIRRHESLFALIDLGSGNGTFLNGKKVEGLTLLNDGDGVSIGKYRLRFQADTDAGFDLGGQLSADAMELGGMTLRLTPEDAQRQGAEQGRVRGLLVLPGPPGSEPVRVPLGEVFSIGKDPRCDMALKGWFAPKRAALICRGFDRYTLINVSGSDKDVLVSGKAVKEHQALANADRVEVYGQRFIFLVPEES